MTIGGSAGGSALDRRRCSVSSPPAISETPVAVRMRGQEAVAERATEDSPPDRHPSSGRTEAPRDARTGTLRPMGSRLSIVAGLVAGVIVALALLAGFVLVGPDPGGAVAPRVAVGVASRRRRRVVAERRARRRASPSASAPASGSPVAVRIGSGVTTNFHVGQPAPPLARAAGRRRDDRPRDARRARPVWVNFMQTTCPPLHRRVPADERLRGAVRATTASSSSRSTSRRTRGRSPPFAERLNATFPLGLDTDGGGPAGVGRVRPAGPLLDRPRRDRPRRRARRDRAGHHGPRRRGDPAGGRGHAVGRRPASLGRRGADRAPRTWPSSHRGLSAGCDRRCRSSLRTVSACVRWPMSGGQVLGATGPDSTECVRRLFASRTDASGHRAIRAVRSGTSGDGLVRRIRRWRGP